MNEWYIGNVVYKQEEYIVDFNNNGEKKTSYIEKERVLVRKLDNHLFKVVALNKVDNREYNAVETDITLSSVLDESIDFVEAESDAKTLLFPCGIRNLELVEKEELVPEIISHLGLYLKYQNDSGIYDRDEEKSKKITL